MYLYMQTNTHTHQCKSLVQTHVQSVQVNPILIWIKNLDKKIYIQFSKWVPMFLCMYYLAQENKDTAIQTYAKKQGQR